MVTRNERQRIQKKKELSLMLGMFFLPFGYDFLFKTIMDITGSFWAADVIFYLISGSFFLSYIYYSKRLDN